MTDGTGHGPGWTPRQREVLDLLARGRTNGQIAEALGITLDGAKWHVSEIIGKLDLDTREEAAEYWRQRQGFRARLRLLTRTGSAPALLRWLGIGGAATAAVVVVAVRDLSIGPEIELPSGAVLYYYQGCYACDGPGQLRRAYRRESGELVTERVLLGLPVDDVSLLSTTLAPDGTRLVAQFCHDQRCTGLAGFEPGAFLHTFVSTDGGISWDELDPGPPVESYVRGSVGDEWLIITNAPGQAVPRYWLYPSGVTLEPPLPGAHAWVTGEGDLIWREQGDPQRPRHVDSDGVPLPGADIESGVIAYFDFGDPQGRAIYLATARQDFSLVGGTGLYVITTDGPRATAAFRWPHSSVNLADRIGDRWLLGNALYPDGQPDRQPPADWPDSDYRPIFIDLESATVHSIAGLPRGDGGWSYPIDIVSGEAVLRIATNGSCLNVREAPSTEATSLRCYFDGVLLLERDAVAPDGWVAVTTPDGRDGWASAEFLER